MYTIVTGKDAYVQDMLAKEKKEAKDLKKDTGQKKKKSKTKSKGY